MPVGKVAEDEGTQMMRAALSKVAAAAKEKSKPKDKPKEKSAPKTAPKPSKNPITGGDVAAAGAGGVAGSVLGSGMAVQFGAKGIADDAAAAAAMKNPDSLSAAFRRLKTGGKYAIPMGISTAALAVLLKRKYGVQE
jgi:hypothetical protein